MHSAVEPDVTIRFATCVSLVLLVLAGCSSVPPPPADQVAARLAAAITEADLGATLTPETDPNRLLGRPGQYTSAATVVDQRVPEELRSDPTGVDAGAKVEVFSDESEAQARADYIGQIAEVSPLGVEYDYQVGAVLLRVSKELPPATAEQYRAALDSVLQS